MAHFHKLTVTQVRKTIRDAVAVTLAPQSGDFDFEPGQYLTFRQTLEGTDIRRSYSICAGVREECLQVGIKKVAGGAFSTWANETLRPGMVLEAMQPAGRFHVPLSPDASHNYLGFAGGSGITPVLSILKSVLTEEPQSRFTLIYANRGVHSIMFREELEDLKNQHMGRLSIHHVLESDAQEVDLFRGRVDVDKCNALFASVIDVASVDTALICGPEPMMLGISRALKAHGLAEDQIRFELFASAQHGRLARKPGAAAGAATVPPVAATLTLDGATRSFEMDRDTSVLEAALAEQIDVPFACKAGVCSTCMCRVVEGEVEMVANHALEDYEVKRGFILSCQSYPLTNRLVLDYDVAGHGAD